MRRLIPALALLAAAAPASADWLRVDFHTVTTPYLTFLGPDPFDFVGNAGESYVIDGWMLIDTDQPPIPRGDGDTAFPVADFEINARRYDGAGGDPIVLDPDNASAQVTVLPTTRGVQFFVGNLLNTFSYDIPRTATLFSISMTSLPDAPGDYAASGNSLDTVVCEFTPATGTATDCTWARNGGHEIHKYIRYHVRTNTAPGPEPCGPADINRDGLLNFDDIDAFVNGFLGGCG